jgi:hypothetical protein
VGVKGSEPDERLSFELAPWPVLFVLLPLAAFRLAKESLGTIDFLHDCLVGAAAGGEDEEAMELAPWLLVLLAQEDEADESDSCVELLLTRLGVALSLEGAGLGWR